MPVGPPTYVGDFDSTNPIGTDTRNLLDDSDRQIKESVRMSFPEVKGAVTATHGDLNTLTGVASGGGKVMTGNGAVTKAIFFNPTAPLGWTIDSVFTADMLVTAGTINGTLLAGGDRAGTDDPGLMDKVPTHVHNVTPAAHRHFVAVDLSSTYLALTPTNSVVVRRTSGNDEEKYFLSSDVGQSEPTVGRTSSAGADTVASAANTGAANWVPKVAAGIVCTLNA